MYFTIEWPKQLRLLEEHQSQIRSIHASRDRLLFLVLTDDALSLWFCKPPVELLHYRRSLDSVNEFGPNLFAEWRHDSTTVALATEGGHLLFFRVESHANTSHPHLFVQTEGGRYLHRRDESNVHLGAGIPSLSLSHVATAHVLGGVTCLVCIREDLMVGTGNGSIQRFRWDGTIVRDMNVSINSIPLSVDLQHSRASPIASEDVCIAAMEYSAQMGGFAAVLTDGRAAFITSTSPRFHPHNMMGVWATGVRSAACVAVNHRYRLVAFGCTNGEGQVFTIDEVTGALILSHQLCVSSKDFPDAAQSTGGVWSLAWSPDGCALAMAWDRGGYSLWSVFGALLICTLSSDQRLSYADGCLVRVSSMAWGMEGYHLWAVPDRAETGMLQLQFVKSALAANPSLGNHEHLFLQGEDRVYINTHVQTSSARLVNVEQNSQNSGSPPSSPVPDGTSSQVSSVIMSKQLEVLQIPHSYIASNWPIRSCAVDRSGSCIAVAGKTGLCHYASFSKRWKLFGNETQEHDMMVTGGMTWWKDFVCAACFDINDQREEIRFYPRGAKLDNTFAQCIRLSSPVLLLNVFRDTLIVFCADCQITLYQLNRKNTHPAVSVDVQKLQEVCIDSFIPLATSVIAVTLTSLRIETGQAARTSQSGSEAESILLNYAGKLLMFQREKPHVSYHSTTPTDKIKPLPFTAPVMVASNVECVWSSSQPTPDKPYLMEALWLGCGVQSMKVWLPLLPRDESKTPAYMSKRIMLPFSVNIYPLCISFEEAIVLGVSHDYASYQSPNCDIHVPYSTLEKATQIYLHHILRQLLRRNLGTHAVELARCCTELNHFSHTLELLLHEVLEEEATSKEPIPDPLLPRIVAFIAEFPQHLQTIVHCARKTEVALWPYLFSSAGDPKELFEECLSQGDLDTGAFYLIILQNLEAAAVSQQQATLLLGAALENCKWSLARDLVRFLSIIGKCAAEESSAAHKHTPPAHAHILHTPPISPSESSQFAYSRHRKEMEQEDLSKKARRLSAGKSTLSSNNDHGPPPMERQDSMTSSLTAQTYIDGVLSDHARKLLRQYRLYDLGRFSANLDDYQLIAWLRKENIHAAKVLDFVTALKQLHLQFQWPFPIAVISPRSSISYTAEPPSLTLTPHTTSTPVKSVMELGHLNLLDAPNHVTREHVARDHVARARLAGESEAALEAGDLSHGANVVLRPQTLPLVKPVTETCSQTTTELSENSSLLGGDLESGFDQSPWVELGQNGLDQLTFEFANKGPSQSEIELRYLYQIFLEAGCLEWALLIAVVLRDSMSVIRTANTASMTDTPIEMVGRMREGLSFLQLWAETECPGYRPFLAVIRSQAAVLDKIIEINPPVNRLSAPLADDTRTSGSKERTRLDSTSSTATPEPVRTKSVSSRASSVHGDSDNESVHEPEPEPVPEEQASGCQVS